MQTNKNNLENINRNKTKQNNMKEIKLSRNNKETFTKTIKNLRRTFKNHQTIYNKNNIKKT